MDKGLTPSLPPLKPPVNYNSFFKLDLRVGLILEAEKIANSCKMMKMIIDLGFEKRTIVSGIALAYAAKDLIGREVIVVANLEPVKIMGIESQGMILTTSKGEKLEIAQIQHAEPGTIVS